MIMMIEQTTSSIELVVLKRRIIVVIRKDFGCLLLHRLEQHRRILLSKETYRTFAQLADPSGNFFGDMISKIPNPTLTFSIVFYHLDPTGPPPLRSRNFSGLFWSTVQGFAEGSGLYPLQRFVMTSGHDWESTLRWKTADLGQFVDADFFSKSHFSESCSPYVRVYVLLHMTKCNSDPAFYFA